LALRILDWLHRFALASSVLGLRAAFTIFVPSRYSCALRQITLPDGRRFTFRGKLDQGVMSHFYKEGYRIRSDNSHPPSRIIDAGANIGDETARFLHHCPNATIVAIEAEERNFEVLRTNFADVPNVRCIHGGLWPTEGRVKVVNESAGGGHMESFRVVPTSDPNGLVAWSIPRILEEMGWDAIDLLKLDIEGSEYELFTSNTESWIDRVNAIIIEVADHERAGTIQTMYAALHKESFNSYICGENLVLIKAGVPWSLDRVVGLANP
jgi:FkbM family methyltransferase